MKPEYQQMIDYVRALKEQGAAMVADQIKVVKTAPADLGIFGGSTFPAFEFGKAYQPYDVFSYDGNPGYVRQAHTSQAQWVPFSPGTESIYGARPKMEIDGTYNYVYNMAATEGMQIRDTDGLYQCVKSIDGVIWPLGQLPEYFVKV